MYLYHYIVMNKMTDKKIKTTINISEILWKKFSIKVIQVEGGRMNSAVISDLIRKYINGEIILGKS